MSRVDTAVLQRAFADSGVTVARIARNLGWVKTVPDSQRVRQRLGLKSNSSYGGTRHTIKTTSYDHALQMIEAMGLDPVDYGL